MTVRLEPFGKIQNKPCRRASTRSPERIYILMNTTHATQ